MALDIEFYRRNVYVPARYGTQSLRRISVVDIHPEGAVQTVVFVHGFGGSVSQWIHQLRFFGQSMRVVAPNLRGHGLSEDPPGIPYTIGSFVSDLEEVLAALQVQAPFHLVAHSFGGAISTEYVIRHPEMVRSLTLIGVSTHFTMMPVLGRLLRIPDPLFSFAAKRLKIALFAQQRTLKGINDNIMSTWRMQPFSVPTLVVLGYRDRVFRRKLYEDVLRCNPTAQLVDIPVSAHLVQLERPDAVNRAIDHFIEKQDPGAKGLKGGEKKQPSIFQRIARKISFAAQHSDMPWLNRYDSGVPAQIPPPKQLLHEMLNTSAAASPRRSAIIFFDRQIQYRELDDLSTRFAHALRGLGIKPGDRVAIVLPNIPQCVIAFYGVLKAGAVVVMGDPLLQEQELHRQLQDSGARALLTQDSLRDLVKRVCLETNIAHVIYTNLREYLPRRQRDMLIRLIKENPLVEALASPFLARNEEDRDVSALPSGRPAFRVSSFKSMVRRKVGTPLFSETSSNDLALIQYTTGMTGLPKGVMLSHGNLTVNAVQLAHWMTDATREREIILSMFPLSHIYGITTGMNTALALSSSLLLVPTANAEVVLNAIKRHKPSMLIGYPGLLLEMANYPGVRNFGVSAIRFCLSSSAPLSVEVHEAFEKLTKGHLIEGYGLSEASPLTHVNPYKSERGVGSIGLPLPSTQARIVDLETGETLPTGGVGELLIKGPQIMQGYWQVPQETAQVLHEGWLSTNDVMQMDEDGYFTFIDRKQNLTLSGTHKIYPREVEEVLYEHPKVFEVAVVSMVVQAEKEGRRSITGVLDAPPLIKAFVVAKRGQKVSTEELLKYASERLEDYKVPQQIEFCSELPKNAVGKIVRGLLIK